MERFQGYYPYPIQKKPEAFSLKIEEPTDHSSLYKLIESYLGEYRFQLPVYHYQLKIENGELIDPLTKESMVVKALRALKRRKELGLNTQREEKELEALEYLGENLRIGDTVIWVSPPGEKNEGYGNYGFFFYGIVSNDGSIEMTARRVDLTDDEFKRRDFSRFAQTLSSITQNEKYQLKTDLDFLGSPVILRPNEGVVDIDEIIAQNFGRIDFEKLREFGRIIDSLRPLIEEFIRAYQNREDPHRLRKILNVIENLAQTEELAGENPINLSLVDFRKLEEIYGFTPPQVFGSCGGTSPDDESSNFFERLSTSNIFGKLGLDQSDKYGLLTFRCPHCGETHRREKNQLLEYCPKTGQEIPKC